MTLVVAELCGVFIDLSIEVVVYTITDLFAIWVIGDAVL
jgi:hypothetical protein